MTASRTRTYILERTCDFFTGRSDEPCSGAVRLEPANSGAAPPRLTASTAVLRSPAARGLMLRPPPRPGLTLGPHQRRGKRVNPGPRRPV
jgi:hypothetical protein